MNRQALFHIIWAMLEETSTPFAQAAAHRISGAALRMLLTGIIGIVALSATPLSAQIADSFGPAPSSSVYALAVQPDGKILIGGLFSSVNGKGRNGIAQLNPDGTLNDAYNPTGSGSLVYSLAIQPDGKVLVGGSFSFFGGSPRRNIARLNTDGTLDPTFSPTVSNTVYSIALQSDGRILLGGTFTGISGQIRRYIARLNSDGSLDTQFNPGADNTVYTLAIQTDGGIVAGGRFTSLASGEAYLGRVDTNGVLDSSFLPSPDNWVQALLILPDGKIIVGGRFANLGGSTCNHIGRLNTSGTLDTNFDPGADGFVYALALQTDGKLLVGGTFTNLLGQLCAKLGRINPDGTLDNTFNPGVIGTVNSLALQTDGKLLVGGGFTSIAGAARTNLARLSNTDPATQTLAFNNTSITWLRTNASPEVWRSSFALTANGSNWTTLGDGSRISGGWQLTGLSLPTNATIRARGSVTSGQYNGSSWFAETFAGFPAFTLQPVSLTNLPATVASFSAAAIGSPITYQWYKNGIAMSDGPTISGTATPTLTVSNVFGGDTGNYFVLASNSFGSITSAVAILTVLDPVVTNQPVSQLINVGQSVTFTLSAAGTTPTYQWRKNGQNIAGATTTSLSITNAQWADRGNFDVIVSNRFGSVTSVVAVLNVNMAYPDVTTTGANDNVRGFAEQTNGSILVSGAFGTLAGQNRTYLGRLDSSCALDPTFNSPVNGTFGSFTPGVWAIGMQLDSKLMLIGDFRQLNSDEHDRIGRIFPDGTPDSTFNYNAADWVMCLLSQPDGRMLVGGSILNLANSNQNFYCSGVARVAADGTIETNFTPGIGGYVRSLALQTNGQIILGGYVGSLEHSFPVTNLARIFPDGTPDTNFLPSADAEVYALALQADGKILVGGMFSTLCGQPRTQLGRLNSDGTLDTNFNPVLYGVGPSGTSPNYNVPFIESIVVQADGKILIGGMFTNLCGEGRSNLGRLNPDGTIDPTFDPWVEGIGSAATALALQANGKILVGGGFTSLAGLACTNFGRLNNTEPATQALSFDGSTVTWLRGGTAPEVYAAVFDVQTDGSTWSRLGSGVHVPGGWQLAQVSVPLNAIIRARGLLSGGAFNASSWFVGQTLTGISNTPPRILPATPAFGTNHFSFGLQALPGQSVVIEATTNFINWMPLQTNLTTGTGQFLFNDSQAGGFPRRFYRARLFRK